MLPPATSSSQPPLFRPEVLQARQSQWLGSIRIGRPLSFSVITGASLSMAAVLIAFAAWGEITRKVNVHGLLLPIGGLINVSSPQAGVVAEILVSEGAEVRAGQPLLRLKSERLTAGGDAALLNAQALTARRESLATERRLTEQNLRQRLDSIAQRMQSLQMEARQAQAELEAHRLRVQLAVKSVERQTELARSGFVAAAQLQTQQETLLDLQLRERNAERNWQALQRDLGALRAERESAQTQSQTTMAQLDRSSATLSQEAAENDARNGLTLTAPQAGRVSAFTLGAGQSVQAGQTLVSLLPANAAGVEAELQAQLYAPSRTAGFVQLGQTVWLRYAAFPYQKFGMAKGEVVAVSRSPIAPQDLPNGQGQALLAAAQANEPLYRITVRLPAQTITTYGTSTPLAAGMRLDADVQQERRRIWEWMLEPLWATVGLRRNMGDDLRP